MGCHVIRHCMCGMELMQLQCFQLEIDLIRNYHQFDNMVGEDRLFPHHSITARQAGGSVTQHVRTCTHTRTFFLHCPTAFFFMAQPLHSAVRDTFFFFQAAVRAAQRSKQDRQNNGENQPAGPVAGLAIRPCTIDHQVDEDDTSSDGDVTIDDEDSDVDYTNAHPLDIVSAVSAALPQ